MPFRKDRIVKVEKQLEKKQTVWTGRVKWPLTAFFLCFLCAFISMGPFLIKEGGLFTLSNDFNAQELAFNMFANEAVKNGEIFWNWNIDIGSDFVATFSFYNLGSPFFWITLLFPAKLFPYLVGWVYMLKYAVAGLTAYLYLHRFIKEEKFALIAAVLYAFSGFQACNLVFYHFHDVVAFFPILLIGLEKMVLERKKGIFAVAVFFNAFLNYFFFIGEVVFLIVYFVVRFWISEKQRWKSIPQCLLEGALGIGMAAVLFFPSIINILGNSRVSQRLTGISALIYDWKDYLLILKALFLPGENMARTSSVVSENWYSVAAWLPMTGIVLVIAYIIRNKKSWITRMILVCLLFAFIPLLNNSFVGFTLEPYRRWYYMLVLMFCLASGKMLENRDFRAVRVGTLVTAAFVCLFGIGLIIYNRWHSEEDLIGRPLVFVLFLGVALAGAIITLLLHLPRTRCWYANGMLTGIILFSVLTTAGTVFSYRQGDTHVSSRSVYNDVIQSGGELDKNALPYRYRFWENYYNRGMASYLPTRNSFCTTVSPFILEFYDALGTQRHTIGVEGPEGTDELLGTGYVVSQNELTGVNEIMSYSNGNETLRLYDTRSLPIGFSYDTYMLKSDFEELDSSIRAVAMLKNLVIDDEDEGQVAGILRKYDENTDGEIILENKEEYIASHNERITDFEKDARSFSSKIKTDREKYVYFSVPYDSQWSVIVNGERSEILKINGLMAVKVPEGNSTIEFEYTPVYLYCGAGVSLLSWIIWIIYRSVDKRGRKN